MRKVVTLLAVIFSLALKAQDLKVMTFNIRLNTASDSLNAWPYRKDLVASQVLFHDVDILGVQEALNDQMLDLQSRLPQYHSIGGGREDGKTKGEYSAIFYNTQRIKVLSNGMFWLSQTPDVPGSIGWDAAITRIVTWTQCKDLQTRKLFFVFNTHFDHMGKIARRESARLLINKVKEISGPLPAIVMGDFNAEPSDEPIQEILKSEIVKDSKALSQSGHYGPTGSFNAFKNKEINDQPIDYIFLKGSWKVKKHGTLSQSWQGRFASDHFAILAHLAM